MKNQPQTKLLITTATIIIFQFCTIIINAQTPNWKWAKTACNATGINISTDANSNSYVIGNFNNYTAIFGTYTITSAAFNNMFVAKYDSIGNFIWAKTVTTASATPSHGYSIKTDANGNSYLIGDYQGGSVVVGNYTLTSQNTSPFIAKYDALGNVLWAKNIDQISSMPDCRLVVNIDGQGNSYVSGRFGNDLTTDSTMLIKYDNVGNIAWKKAVKGTGANGQNTNWSVSSSFTDPSGNSYVTGVFNATTLSFDGTVINRTSAGSGPMFIVKYNTAGNVMWAKSVGTFSPSIYKPTISLDLNGNIYISGMTGGTYAGFGSTTLTNKTIFLVKFDNLGNVIWATGATGACCDKIYSITNDINGDIYMTGMFLTTATFGNHTVYCYNYPQTGNADMFITKYDTTGNALWVKTGGGISIDGSNGISQDPNGNIYTTGYFYDVKAFYGNNTLWNCDTIAGSAQMVVSKIGNGNSVGINEHAQSDDQLNFFPNPTTNESTFKTKHWIDDADIIIYNTAGQEVKKINNISGLEFKIEKDDLGSGIYFVRLIDNNFTIMDGKLIIVD